MPADAPTIVATSGGFRFGRRTDLEFTALVHHAVDPTIHRLLADGTLPTTHCTDDGP